MNSVTPVAVANRIQAKAADPAASVWVSASAGSGKTKVLTDRVLALLLTGTKPERILCLTFTKAAAAEMSNRIAMRLARWVTLPFDELEEELAPLLAGALNGETLERARRLFAQVIDAAGGLQISTIHAFCQSLLRRFPLESGIAPHFTLMDERDSAEALLAAQEIAVAEARSGKNTALAQALSVVTARVHETNFADLARQLIAARAKLTRMLASDGVEGAVAAIRARLGVAANETEDSLIAAACHDDAFAHDALRDVVAAMQGGKKTDQERAAIIGLWLADTVQRAQTFEIYTRAYLTEEGNVRARLVTQKIVQLRPDTLTVLQQEAERLRALLAQLKAVRVAACTEALLRLGAEVLAVYRADKERRGLMDYDDLIQTARRLLERPGLAAWVLFKLDGGLDHVLIDEAQDTNPDQWAIIHALTAEFFTGQGRHEEKSPETPRTVFAVGDRKQSIYGFQGAAPDEFDRMQAMLRARADAVAHRWEPLTLNVSFRSAPAVLDTVHAVFTSDTARNGLAETADELVHLAARSDDAGLVEMWPPLEPAVSDALPSWKPPVERTPGDSPAHRLAALIARRIAHMINGGEQLPAKGRGIRAGDIMVLVRRRTGFVEELVRQLKRDRIAVAGVDRMVLTDQMAVMDLVALGQFLLLPEDDLTLAAVLKGPLVGLSEEDLFTLAYNRASKRLWETLSVHSGTETIFGRAHAFLADLLARADYVSPAELYGHVLIACDGRRNLLARLGLDADDPIDEFMNLALAYQRTHAPSLQGFLHWLAASDTEIKRDLEQGRTDAVRIITVHGAKGLQAPIVFLPDTCQPPALQDRLLWTGDATPLLLWAPSVADLDAVTQSVREEAALKQEREYRRLLYVALTRAEDRLYICGWQSRKPRKFETSWYTLIKAGLSTLPQTQTVVDDFLAREGTLPSGEVLRLESPQRVTPKPEPSPDAGRKAGPLPVWFTHPAPAEKSPPKPLAPSRAALADPPPRSPQRDDGKIRFQRGLMIHRLLQTLPDIPPARRRAAATAFVERPSWGLAEAQQQAIVGETLAVLDAPSFAPLFAPGSRAEVPLTGLVGGYAISGQVDRLAVTPTEVWVIDYKTNRPPPQRTADVDMAYVFQMASYRAALQAIYPKHRVRCVLLWTDGPFTMELESAALDDVLRRAGLI